jgi:hypothetical protein
MFVGWLVCGVKPRKFPVNLACLGVELGWIEVNVIKCVIIVLIITIILSPPLPPLEIITISWAKRGG